MKARSVCTLVFLLSVSALSQSPASNQQSTQITQGGLVSQSSQPDRDAILAMPALGLAAPTNKAEFTPVIANGVHLVVWDRGHLASFGAAEMREPVTLYDKSGKWLFEKWLTFEGAVKTYAQDAGITKSGTVVVAAAALSPDGAVADMIVEVGRDGVRRVIRTSPFNVLKLCVTDEETVWAYGQELTDDRKGERQVHYPMLREYSFDKGELRSALDRATVHIPKEVPLDGARGEFQMRCTPKGVNIVDGLTNEVMEYDFSADKLLRWPIAPLPDRFYINGEAVTGSGGIYVSTLRPGRNALTGILRLHVDSTGMVEWTPLTIVPPSNGNFFLLLGNDGDDLVYSRGRSASTLYWSPTGKSEVPK